MAGLLSYAKKNSPAKYDRQDPFIVVLWSVLQTSGLYQNSTSFLALWGLQNGKHIGSAYGLRHFPDTKYMVSFIKYINFRLKTHFFEYR